MNIKSLLLGSAAALVAVTGAKAADAPVTMVEPEPVEYVRVCDVYGTGFFYIPGTETCLKIGGYVRMRIQGNDNEYNNDIDGNGAAGRDVGYGYNVGTRVRARLDFDAREETELGTLRAKIRLEATNRPTSGVTGASFNSGDLPGENPGVTSQNFAAEEAYIQLGGLTMGYLDSAWTADDGGISDGLLTDTDFAAGDFQANRISYTAAFSGFSGTLSVEDDGTGDWIPDVIAKLAYKGGFGGAYIMGVYDEDSTASGTARFGELANGIYGNYVLDSEDFGGRDGGAFVVKAGVQLENLILADSILKIEGHYAFDPSDYATVGNVFRYNNAGINNFGRTVTVDPLNPAVGTVTGINVFNLPSEFQIGAGYQQTFGKLFAAVSGVYGQTFDLDNSTFFEGVTGTPVNLDLGSADYFGGSLNVGYQITSNFSTLAEVSYVNVDLPGGLESIDQTRGFLEFKRTF